MKLAVCHWVNDVTFMWQDIKLLNNSFLLLTLKDTELENIILLIITNTQKYGLFIKICGHYLSQTRKDKNKTKTNKETNNIINTTTNKTKKSETRMHDSLDSIILNILQRLRLGKWLRAFGVVGNWRYVASPLVLCHWGLNFQRYSSLQVSFSCLLSGQMRTYFGSVLPMLWSDLVL